MKVISSKKKEYINRKRVWINLQQRVYNNNNNNNNHHLNYNHHHHHNNNHYYEPNYGPSNHYNYHNSNSINNNNINSNNINSMMNCHFDRMIMNQDITNRCEQQTGLNNNNLSVENYWTSIAFHRPQDSLFGNSILPILPRIGQE